MASLFVIRASAEPTAVILRRGPSRWFHVIQWQTQRDVFTHGAWIKGRIYPNKCDISPDGRLLLYFVHQDRPRATPGISHAWTAISRTPWLHALTLWPQDTTYGGGGRFVDDRTVVLRGSSSPHPDFPLGGVSVAQGTADHHEPTHDVPDADWCGRDARDRIIFTLGDLLFRRVKGTDTLVADFSDLSPDPAPPPDWATRPI